MDIAEKLYNDAKDLVIKSQQGSTSLLQRKLKIGYNLAGKIMQQMELDGIVGPFNNTKPREVLVKTAHKNTINSKIKILKNNLNYGNPTSRQDTLDDVEMWVFLPHVLKAMDDYLNEFKVHPKKSLQECKDEVWDNNPLNQWKSMMVHTKYEKILDEAAELYLQSNVIDFKRKIEERDEFIKEVLGIENSWPLIDVLKKLMWATEYLLTDKDYDGNKHEELRMCVDMAKAITYTIEKAKPFLS